MTSKIKEEYIDELIKECKNADDILGSNGIAKQLTKRLLERMLETELTSHLGYDKYQKAEEQDENNRNGHGLINIYERLKLWI